MLTTNISYLII